MWLQKRVVVGFHSEVMISEYEQVSVYVFDRVVYIELDNEVILILGFFLNEFKIDFTLEITFRFVFIPWKIKKKKN